MRDPRQSEDGELKALALALLIPGRTLSYIGAGTGSLIIQVVIAAAVGGLFALKIYWRRIKAFFTRRKEAAGEACAAQDASPDASDGDVATGEAVPGYGQTQEEIEAALLPPEPGCEEASAPEGGEEATGLEPPLTEGGAGPEAPGEGGEPV